MEPLTARAARARSASLALALALAAAATATGLSRLTPVIGALALGGVACLVLAVTVAHRLLPLALTLLGSLLVVSHANGIPVYALPFLVAALPTIAQMATVSDRLKRAATVEPRPLTLAIRRALRSGLVAVATASAVLAAAELPVVDGALAGLAGAAAVTLSVYWAERLATR